MATFAQKSFSATSYAIFRPSYPPKLYNTVLNYHHGPRNTLLDLGCGHGVVSRALAPHFGRVWGTDPSVGMIAQAGSLGEDPESGQDDGEIGSQGSGSQRWQNIQYKVASAEDLSFLEDSTLDMIVAGQAAHWFNFPKVWGELHRKLRKGGTVAFWGYKDNLLVDFPEATRVLDKFCYGEERRYMGGFWEQPGRERLRGLYGDAKMRPPREWFGDVRRITYEPGLQGKGSGVGEVLMGRRMKLGELEGYWRTFSAFHEWERAHPERKRLEIGAEGKGEGDVIDEMFAEMLEVEPELRGKEGQDWRDVEVETEWGTVILLASKL